MPRPRFTPAWGWILFFDLLWALVVLNFLNQVSHLSGNGGLFR